MKHTIKFLIILLLAIACKEPKSIYDIKICVEDSRKTSLSHMEDFSIYQKYGLFENLLVKRGGLDKFYKQTYIKLLKELQLNNNKVFELKKQMKKEMRGFDILSEPMISEITINCIKDYLENGDLEEDKIATYKNSFDTLLSNDLATNIQFIENTPKFLFIEFDFRIPILTIIYFKLIAMDGSGELTN